ncbi:uncharacterized protein [Phaseolus vulgaris]|uniref:uncharacterized protein n=1 Tax=Phaseolus vulgaris TaxID=3885 RepID=UPI0035CC1D85
MAKGSKGFLIPWTCLKDYEISPAKTVYDKPGQRKSFAQALGTTCDIPLSELPTPCIKGDMIVVRIDEEDYLARLEDCKTHSWSTTMKSTKTQAWVRLYKLPLEYWRSRAIFSIIKGLGTPLSLDENIMRKKKGMFARVLVDINMLSPLPDHLLVERSDYTFVVGVEYEWLPPFCSHCKMIGHELAQCRVIHDQGRVLGPQQKSSHKILSDEPNKGMSVAPKQRQEYSKKDP